MQTFYINKDNINEIKKPKNLVLGFFDGIHKGHENLFYLPETSLLTFVKIPRKTTNLFSLNDRLEYFKNLNLDNLYLFDILSNNLTAKEFIEKILVPLNPSQIIVGENFSFGNDGQSAYYLQMNYPNVNVVKIKNKISSSHIRYLLTANKPNFKKINKLLSIPYFRTSTVVHGYHEGQKLGIRTANIKIDCDLIDLMDGVYITMVCLDDKEYEALTFWGKTQTLNHQQKFIESWLFDYNGPEFYGKDIKITFLKYLRKPKKFKSKLALLSAIKKDYQKAKIFFKKNH